MSALSRFGPKIANRATLFYQQQPRHMASAAAATDPVQKIFIEKVREFKSSNKGLDAAHQKAMSEEMLRLKRVFKVEDESKLTQMDYKFTSEVNVNLHDIEEDMAKREAIASGEYQKQLVASKPVTSAFLETIPDQTPVEFELPPSNKPSNTALYESKPYCAPTQMGETKPDYEFTGQLMTPELLAKDMRVHFGPNMPTINDDKAPERDTVNFPRQPQPVTQPPTRYHIVPESWFQFFYPKTGVTGPYIFTASLSTFLLSKEIVVYDHDLLTGITTTIIFAYAVNKFGPALSKYAREGVKDIFDGWERWRTGNIAFLNELQNHYKGELKKSDVIEQLYQIRHQDIEMQLEGEYRNRLKTVYEDTKRRLNYLVAVADSQRHVAHQNMVNWVVSNAVSSIGPKQEAEVLDSCIVNLKQLASKNQNVV